MHFQDTVKKHLGLYRKESLGIQEAGLFKYRGKEIPKEHILPTKHRTKNILPNYRDEFFSSEFSHISFHKYFHHLNSSQALCINLFYPLLSEEKAELILDLLGAPRKPCIDASFEKESELESAGGRKTNFDFYMRLSDDVRIFFEVKYSEAEFGKAKKDAEHRAKYLKTYHPLLQNNVFIRPEYCKQSAFLDSYQILRNLCHISDDSFVVFVYPVANKKIHSQARLAQEKMLTNKGRERFKILPLETTIEEILQNVESTKLLDHYEEFRAKYINYSSM